MEIKTENSVQERAMPRQEEYIRYRVLLTLIENLHERGDINESEKSRAERLSASRHHLKNNSIFIKK